MQWWHDHVGYAWYVEPGVFISQLCVQHATVETAIALQDVVDDVLQVEGEHLKALGGLSVLHDWRAMESYEPRARRVYTERMRQRPVGYLKNAVLCVHLNPVLRLAMQTGNLIAAVVAPRARVRIVDDPEPLLARLGVRVPARDAPFPAPPR